MSEDKDEDKGKDGDLLESDDILLVLRERLHRKTDCGKPSLIYLKKDIEQDIATVCRGSKSSIINCLVRMGLDQLISSESDTQENCPVK